MTRAKNSGKSAPGGPAMLAAVDESRVFHLSVVKGENFGRAIAGAVARGLVTNASTVIRFESHEHKGLSLTEMTRELRALGEAVNGGDLSTLERTLTAQALSLNAIFGELARIAQCNLFKVPEVAERYLRLALKAQGQSRATVETLAAMKNPPVVFARQANISNGPQQVNNGGPPGNETSTRAPAQYAPARAPAANQTIEQNELLGASDGERLDGGAQGAAGEAN